VVCVTFCGDHGQVYHHHSTLLALRDTWYCATRNETWSFSWLLIGVFQKTFVAVSMWFVGLALFFEPSWLVQEFLEGHHKPMQSVISCRIVQRKAILQCASWRSQLFSSWLQCCSCLIACRKTVEFHPKVFLFCFGWWPIQNCSLQPKKRKKGEKNWTWQTPHLINTKMNNPKNIR